MDVLHFHRFFKQRCNLFGNEARNATPDFSHEKSQFRMYYEYLSFQYRNQRHPLNGKRIAICLHIF